MFSKSVFYGCTIWSKGLQTLIVKLFTTRQNFRLHQIRSICRDKRKVGGKCENVNGRVENIVGKGENAGNQHFLLFRNIFKIPYYWGVIESWD